MSPCLTASCPYSVSAKDHQYFWLLGVLAGSIGLAVQGFFDTVWYRPDINILWWMSISIITSFYFPKLIAPKSLDLS